MAPVSDTTSVPAWARVPGAQPVDPAAACCTILSYGARSLAAGWSSELTDLGIGHRVITLTSGDQAREQGLLTEELQRAVVGWRLMLVGPLADVLRARSRALKAGLLNAEIILSTTEVERIPVVCAHCRAMTLATTLATTLAATRTTQLLTCRGCSETLVVQDHLSPLAGGFLGVKHDAEQPVDARAGLA
ncbi:hypothetical protein BG28_03430 [Nesterenkonia sp. AN1]|nr:hypothetical protein BG28_03430 [Nesterenkonia sp. AN1]